jgi:hypothetical protein
MSSPRNGAQGHRVGLAVAAAGLAALVIALPAQASAAADGAAHAALSHGMAAPAAAPVAVPRVEAQAVWSINSAVARPAAPPPRAHAGPRAALWLTWLGVIGFLLARRGAAR